MKMLNVHPLTPDEIPRADNHMYFALTPAMERQIKDRNAGQIGQGSTFVTLLSQKSLARLKRQFTSLFSEIKPFGGIAAAAAESSEIKQQQEQEPSDNDSEMMHLLFDPSESDNNDENENSAENNNNNKKNSLKRSRGTQLEQQELERQLKRQLKSRNQQQQLARGNNQDARVDPLLSRWHAEWSTAVTEGSIGMAPAAFERHVRGGQLYTLNELTKSQPYSTLVHYTRFLRKHGLVVTE